MVNNVSDAIRCDLLQMGGFLIVSFSSKISLPNLSRPEDSFAFAPNPVGKERNANLQIPKALEDTEVG